MVYRISWWVDNDGEIIPLKGAGNISPTCGLLETKTETGGGGVASPGRMDFLTALSVLFTVHKHRRLCFSFSTQTDETQGNRLIENKKKHTTN